MGMGFIIMLIVGGVIGWLASIVMRTNGQQGIILNVIVGIVGAVLAGHLLGGPTIWSGSLEVRSLIVSFLGAVALLAIISLVRRGSAR